MPIYGYLVYYKVKEDWVAGITMAVSFWKMVAWSLYS